MNFFKIRNFFQYFDHYSIIILNFVQKLDFLSKKLGFFFQKATFFTKKLDSVQTSEFFLKTKFCSKISILCLKGISIRNLQLFTEMLNFFQELAFYSEKLNIFQRFALFLIKIQFFSEYEYFKKYEIPFKINHFF